MSARRGLIRLGAIVAIVSPLALVAEAAVGWPIDPAVALYSVVAPVFAAVGWLVAERRPANNIGSLMVLFSFVAAAAITGDAYARAPGAQPGADLVGTLATLSDAPLLALLALILIRFPEGALPSLAWRWVDPLMIGITIAAFGGVVLSDDPLFLYPQYTSPLGIPGFPAPEFTYLGYMGMVVMLVAAVLSLIVRWRRGGPVERGQVKWIAAAAVVAAAVEIANVATFDPANPNSGFGLASAIGIALVPVAMGIAILRYRLYEIDRIISRTVAYAVVTGILAVVFVSVILLLQNALATYTQGQTVAVAASTLVVFALFQPLLRRVRHGVDRRFDRARYDAERTAAAFSHRLRNELDMAAVTADLHATVADAIAPTSLSIWLRGRSKGGA